MNLYIHINRILYLNKRNYNEKSFDEWQKNRLQKEYGNKLNFSKK